MNQRFATLLAGLCLLSTLYAADTTMTIRDFGGRGFAPDLVHYALPDYQPGEPLSLTDGEGRPVPVQVTPAKQGKPPILSFVAEVGPDETATYRLSNEPGALAASTLEIRQADDVLEIRTGLLALRTPAPQERTFAEALPASQLPAPILAFRSGDSGWLGESRVLSERKASALRVVLVEKGPAYAEVLYEISWSEGGFYRARLQVIDGVPVVKVTEDYDLGKLDGTDFWELQMVKGWAPDTMETARIYANGGRIDKGSNKPLTVLAEMDNPRLMPGNICLSLSYLGLFLKGEEDAPTGPLAGIVPIHKGSWRRMNVVPVQSTGPGDVRIHFGMTTRHANWWDDVTSETSPFSMQTHEPGLSPTYGRRLWALALGAPVIPNAQDSTVRYTYFHAAQEVSILGPFAQVRSTYGVVGLDRYKDFILEWDEKPPAYPVLYPADPDRKPPALTGRTFQNFMKELRGYCNAPLTAPSISHHLTTGAYQVAGQADAMLARPDLPEELRRELRTRLALIMHLYQEPDFISYGSGAHTGNPNMGTSRYSGMMAFLPLVQDHPSFESWRRHVSAYAGYKLATQTAPAGAYVEYGGYHMHGYARTTNSLPGLRAADASNVDHLYRDYHEPDWDYILNLLAPVDPRFGYRPIPGLANSGPLFTGHFLEAAGSVAESNPALAANLRWAWEQNGRGAAENPWIVPAGLESVKPELKSRVFPGFGVIFRAHQGPEETYMLFRSGFNWSHWYNDPGHLAVVSRGAIILPYQTYGYWGAKDRKQPAEDFDYYNLLRFGDPTNTFPYGWPDGNILTTAFNDSVDYAWMSTGFPDWFITPSINPILDGKLPAQAVTGMKRKLDPAFEQTEGAFEWNRQVLFMKGAVASSPNYFLVHDSMSGTGQLASYSYLNLLGEKQFINIEGQRIHLDTAWPIKGELLFPGDQPLEPEVYEEQQLLQTRTAKELPSNDVRDWDITKTDARGIKGFEKRTILRLTNAPGEGRTWLIYPRQEDEPMPTVQALADGVVQVTHPEGVDTIFCSTEPIHYDQNGILFVGKAGSVRVTEKTVTLVIADGIGKVGYQGTVYEGAAPLEVSLPLD